MQPRRQKRSRAAARTQRPWVPVVLIGGASVLVVGLIILISNIGGNTSGNTGTTPVATPGPTHAAPQLGATIGSDTAPVTMVEYYRFNCPHCRDFATKVEPQLTTDYIDAGKLRIEFRPLVAESDGDVFVASEAAACAGDQNHYWEYYEVVFANFSSGFSKSNLKQYATELGLDTNVFNKCLDSDQHKQDMLNNVNEAISAGLSGVPQFYIGKTSDMKNLSVPYPGQTQLTGVLTTNPYDPFKKAVDDVLAKVQ